MSFLDYNPLAISHSKIECPIKKVTTQGPQNLPLFWNTVSLELVLIYPWDNYFQVEINSAQDDPVAYWMARPNLKNFVLSCHPRYNPWPVIVPCLDEEWCRGMLFWARGRWTNLKPIPTRLVLMKRSFHAIQSEYHIWRRNHPLMFYYHPILYMWCACLSHWFFSHEWW